MDPGEIFRRFFGLPTRTFPPDFHQQPNNENNYRPTIFFGDDEEDDDDEGTSFEFFIGSPGSKDNLEGMFEHFNGGIFREMENLHRQMEEMINGFGSMRFPPSPRQPALPDPNRNEDEKRPGNPSLWFGNPSPFFHQGHAEQPKNPRDLMLKDGDTDDFMTPNSHPHPIYTPPKPEKKEDTDLDGKISDRDILSLVKPSGDSDCGSLCPQQPRRNPGFFSSSSSVTFSTFSGTDGKVEQKKIVRDSNGREHTTVTRSVGDKSHSVTTVTSQDGSQEKHETFQNIDEKDLGSFENLWSTPQQKHPSDQLIQPPNFRSPISEIDPQSRDIFSRLFGFGSKK